MWKRAFIILISLNLFCFVFVTLWFSSLPKASSEPKPVVPVSGTPAPVQVSVGDQAINAYLEYALTEQADVQRVLSGATVHFDQTWNVNLGIKLADRVVPFDLVFQPTVVAGNLHLQIESAVMGELPLPVSALIFVFRHLPWPNWIQVDANTNSLDIEFTQRPANPYGLKVLQYDDSTKLLTLLVTIVPKALLHH